MAFFLRRASDVAGRILAGLLLVAPLPVLAQAGSVPEVLKPYVRGDQFDPGDFGWMRGRFVEKDTGAATPWSEVVAYSDRCTADAATAAKRRLAAMGVVAETLPPGPYGDALCAQVIAAMSIAATSESDIAALPERLAQARRLWEFARAGARIGQSTVIFDHPDARNDAAWPLIQATFNEQFGRKALSWDRDERNPAIAIKLAALFEYLAWDMTGREDRKNSEWLRTYLAAKGWPTISVVGDAASNAAWLLVQHADHDPALQLEALRLMEPLAKAGEASKGNYAYLYDRIMLKLSGKQRYATQFAGCETGEPLRPLRPMEEADPVRIDALRAEMGLGPLADYRTQMDRSFGKCAGTKD